MSTTDPTCVCGHAALAHSNLRDIGCATPDCGCMYSRRGVQQLADDRATVVALDAVSEHTDAIWAGEANRVITELARTGIPFTPDDVWERLAEQGVDQPHEPRALGPIVKGELRAGRIKLEGYATSRRRHGALIRSYTGA